jgi:hypothetical protein
MLDIKHITRAVKERAESMETGHDDLARLARLSRVLRLAALALAGLLVALYAAALLDPAVLEAVAWPRPGPEGFAPGARAGLLAVWGLRLAALLAVLASAAALLARYGRGELFGPGVADLVFRTGLRLVTFAGVMVATVPLASLAASWSEPPGERAVVLSLDAGMLLLALAGGLIVVVGHVLRVASRIAAENEGFV